MTNKSLTATPARNMARSVYRLLMVYGMKQLETNTVEYGLCFVSRIGNAYQIEQAETGIVFNVSIANAWLN